MLFLLLYLLLLLKTSLEEKCIHIKMFIHHLVVILLVLIRVGIIINVHIFFLGLLTTLSFGSILLLRDLKDTSLVMQISRLWIVFEV